MDLWLTYYHNVDQQLCSWVAGGEGMKVWYRGWEVSRMLLLSFIKHSNATRTQTI